MAVSTQRAVRSLVAFAAGLMILAGAGSAAAGTYPPPPNNLEIQLPTDENGNTYIAPNQPFDLVFCCFPPGSIVEMSIDTGGVSGVSIQAIISSGPLVVAADGTVTWRVPGLPAGTFPLYLTVDGVTYKLMLSVGVVIPKAGSDTLSVVRAASILVAAGVAISLVAYRRRPRPVVADSATIES